MIQNERMQPAEAVIQKLPRALKGDNARVLELAIVVFLWQAAVGVYFLSLVQQYLPQQLGTGAAWPGYAMACYGVAKFLWQPVAGFIADRLGRLVVMITGMVISIPVLVLMMEVPSERYFLAFSALLGIGAATMWPAFMAHVGESTPRARRTRTMTMLNIAQMGGIGLGTLAGVLMVDYVTYGAAFWSCIAFSVLALLMVVRSVPASAPAAQIVAVAAGVEPARTKEPEAWVPGIATLAAVVLLLTVGTSVQTPMIGAYTREVLEVKMSFMALLLPIPALIAGIGFWRFMRISDRLGRQVLLAGGLLVAALSIFALTLTTSPYIAVNFVVLAGVAYAISMPAWGAAALDATDAGSRGLWLGALSAVQGLGAAGGQALGGVIGGMYGPLAPFKVAAFMLMMALLLIVAHQYAHSRRRVAAA
ncbi:MAG: MFS transporter [Chloroflexi bacterium]|nr:MFS transporter [Chloroflexota bacterium]